MWACRQECRSSMDGCGPLRRSESAAQWLADVRAYMDPAAVPEGKVQATLFLGVREADGRVVGMLRHCFNEYLEKYAGHIGCSVRPGERRKGYARVMLRLALPFCKELGLDRALVLCTDSNEASRTILANGGVYENTVHEPKEDMGLERYWISLS